MKGPGLTGPRGTQGQEDAGGLVGIVHPGHESLDHANGGGDGFFLANETFAEIVFELDGVGATEIR